MNRYQNITQLSTEKGKKYLRNVKYPEIPLDVSDIYVYSTIGDRFETLAVDYYGDKSLWWIISIASPSLKQNSYYPPLGTQLRIPQNPSAIVSLYNQLNQL